MGVEVLPMSQVSFVPEELRGMGLEVARHRYGCRIFCRLLEHSADHPEPAALIEEVLQDAIGLCRHSFGHYVVQSILEHGTTEQKQHIVDALSDDFLRSVQDRNA